MSHPEDTADGHRRPLRVAYVLKRFPRLSETFILNELLELERQGVEVEVFSLLVPPPEPRHDLLAELRAKVTYLPASSTLDGWLVQQAGSTGELEPACLADVIGPDHPFAELMPGKKPNAVATIMSRAAALALLVASRGIEHMHAHFGSDATTVALLASRLTGIPFSFTAHARDIYHTYVSPEIDARMRRLKMQEAAFVATVSEFNRTTLTNLAGPSSRARIERVYNGIDLSRFAFTGTKHRQSNNILAVGRLIEKKGYGDLVEAARLLRDQGRDFTVTIIGEGPLREDLDRRIAEVGLTDRVRILGAMPQAEVIAHMQRATCLALPCVIAKSGDRDGLPTVLLEALAIGLPAISTRVAGIPEIIDHEADGLLVAPEAPADLADAIARMLTEPELRQRFALAGRTKAEAQFSLTTNVARLRGHLATAAGRHAPGIRAAA